MKVFFFGMGFSSLAAARAIHAGIKASIPVSGTTRTHAKASLLSDASYQLYLFDGTAPALAVGAELRAATHVILSIPPSAGTDPVLRHHQTDLDASDQLQWLCYYSTVGVYGDFGGAWIDEDAATRPQNRRSELRVEVEQQWQDYAARRGIPLLILRLAGIYGPGRSAFDKLSAGDARRIIKPGQVFNRIHVEDIGRITMLASRQKLAGTFNLADDEPAPPQDVIAYAARMMEIPPSPEVPFEKAEMTEMARSFYSDNKRVSNMRIKQALGVELIYSTYREGLQAIYEAHP